MRTEELFIKDIHYSKEINDFLMTFSIPIFSTNKDERHIIAILVAQVDLKNSLYKILLDRTGLGKTGETLIVNKDGLALNELRWYENAPLNLQINAEPVLNAIQGKTGITTTTDYRGEEILVAYTYIAETSWGFVCKQDLSELNAPIRALVNNFVIVFVIVTGLIFLIAFYISNSISNPIVELSRAANKIKGGDYSAQITTTTTNDEIGSLAESTREMAISISSENAIKNGVSDISSAMIGLSSMQEFGEEMLKKMIEITGASMSTFYILNEITSEYEHFASVAANKELLKPFNSQNPEGEFGNAIAKKNIYYMREIPEETIFDFQTTAGNAKPKEIITIPIIVNSGVVALISLVSIYG
jgi:HAMP domain-containing protein